MNYSQVLPFSKKVNMSYNSSLPSNLFNHLHIASQYTLASPISFAGIGLHTGKLVHVTLSPAPANTGIVFSRTDINHTKIPALYNNVIDTTLNTVIAAPNNPEIKIGTIEHLMSALSGNHIHNVFIECNGPEIPVMDGSAAQFTSLIKQAGHQILYAANPAIKILKTIRIEYKDAFAELQPIPEKQLILSLSIDFPASIIGKQKFDMIFTPQNFCKELVFCRTFTFKEEIDNLHKMGLAKGGNLQNAIVVDDEKILNPEGLHCSNEFVKHKMLDAIGDLSLLGHKIYGKFIGHKSGHKLNNMLIHRLMKQQDAWCYDNSTSHQISNIIPINNYFETQEA